MRILLYSPVCPWPPDEGGKMRTMGLLTELAKFHELTLLTTVRSPADALAVEHLRTMLPRVEAVELPNGRWRKCASLLLSLLRLKPYLAGLYGGRRLRRELARLAQGQDAVHAVYPYGAQLAVGLGCLKVMDTQNVEADVLAGNARRASNVFAWAHHLVQGALMRRFELGIAARMDAVLACSESDREFFLKANPETFTVPNAVEGVRERDFPQGKDVVFTGLMGYLANADGARWFRREVWPLVRERCPGARLFLVGKDPRPEVLALAGPDVTVTGRVEDVSEYFRLARVFVCPLRVGSGTRLKILEAFSWGVPVVSTSVGVSGIEAEPGRHLLVADTPRTMADAVADVLGDDGLARRVGEAGRELVLARYTWAEVVKKLNEKVYRQ